MSGSTGEPAARRSMLVWCPDWPVRTAMVHERLPPQAPVAVVDRGQVHACSPAARAEGVRRGLRIRDAQSRCPELVVCPRDDGLALRVFEPVIGVIEAISPGVQVIRPGICAVRAKGVSRYYGGELSAAAMLAEQVVDVGVDDCRIGVADGPFTAEQAARRAAVQDCRIVEPGGSAAFLASLPIGVLEHPTLVGLLRRLGLRTLGAFAELSTLDVLARFGEAGLRAHRLAGGIESGHLDVRTPPAELVRTVDFEPPLARIDEIAFTIRATAESFVDGLAAHGLVVTSVRIDVRSDRGELSERVWLHPRWFDVADLVDRVRWQLAGTALSGPVDQVRFEPEDVDLLAEHAQGLWGTAPDERIQRAMSRVQSMLGHQAVRTVLPCGGRSPAERQAHIAWGDQPAGLRDPSFPWPGRLPEPAPSTIYPIPRPAVVLDSDDRPVAMTDRGALSANPARFAPSATAEVRPVSAWAGPWAVDERWWDAERSRSIARLQVVGVDGSAWLLLVEDGHWFLEAKYD